MEVKEIDLNTEIEKLIREALFRPSILPDKWKKEKIDAYHCQIKDEKLQRVRNATIYTVIGIDLDGNKNLFGYYCSSALLCSSPTQSI